MPNYSNEKTAKSIKGRATHHIVATKFEPFIAGQAIAEGIVYLKARWKWSGRKIAKILHLPSNTLNTWLQNGSVPINSSLLHPEIQALIHLLAIHRSLEAMFEEPIHQHLWLTTFHPELKAVPEQLMGESIEGLILIRQYLDYARGRGA